MHTERRTGRPRPKSNYELFNCNNLNIRYWSWNYRGCWPLCTGSLGKVESTTQTAFPLSAHQTPRKPLQNGCYCFEHPLSSDGVSTSLKPTPILEKECGRCLCVRYDGYERGSPHASSPRD